MSVEVERKFVCNPDIRDKLRTIGAVCVGQRQFKDQYFDSQDFHLTLKDVWLRCRQGCWELKCPSTEGLQGREEAQGERLCTHYKEITSLPQIIAKVREVMKFEEQNGQRVPLVKKEGNESDDQRNKGGAERDTETSGHKDEKKPVSNHSGKPGDTETDEVAGIEGSNLWRAEGGGDLSWLREMNLAPFAEFTTERCSFSLGREGEEGGVRVDLDQADFGYCVGEIEVLVPDGKEIYSALKTIESTADRLGLCSDQRVQGKMHVYLQRYCPEHYTKLLNAHIL